MARPGAGSVDGTSNHPYNHHLFASLPSANTSTAADESEEWEYEYSSTETEIYYLTLDLTTPSIPCARPHVSRGGRGGHRSSWISPVLRRQKRRFEVTPSMSLPEPDVTSSLPLPKQTTTPTPLNASFTDAENVEEDAFDENDEVEEQQESLHISGETHGAAKGLPDSTTAKMPERIQILDLHSENPIITYKTHTFSCKWAENIGTELLFTSHDPGRPLPVLRSLADDVELIAASSARIVSRPIRIIPKAPDLGDPDADFAEKGRRNRGFLEENPRGITIHVGDGASKSRKGQARFLERLMEIKQKKGEKDAVTIVAQRRLYPAGWRAILREKRAEERGQLQLVINNGGSDALEAVKRLKEIEEEERLAEETEELRKENGLLKKSTAGRKPKDIEGARPAKRAKGAPLSRRPRGDRAALNFFDRIPSFSAIVRDGHDDPEPFSTPTPQRWGE